MNWGGVRESADGKLICKGGNDDAAIVTLNDETLESSRGDRGPAIWDTWVASPYKQTWTLESKN